MENMVRKHGVFTPWLIAVAFPLAIMSDAVAAAVHGWRPMGNIEGTALTAAMLWFAMPSILLLIPRGRSWLRAHIYDLLLMTVAMAMAWGAAEWGVHRINASWFSPDQVFHIRGRSIQRTFTPASGTMPGISGVSHYTTDALGVRTPGVPGDGFTCRVLCIGGSTTECLYLDDAETWPALTMKRLNETAGAAGSCWFGNVGFSGFSTLDHLAFVQTSRVPEGFPFAVFQTGINDLYPVLAGEPLRLRVHRHEEPYASRPLWTRSALIQLYHNLHKPLPVGALIEGEDGSEYAGRRAKRQAAPVSTDIPDLTLALRGYQDRIRSIIQACRARGIQPIFITQPVLWSATLSAEAQSLCWFGWRADGSYLPLTVLRSGIDQYNEALTAACREAGIPCLDLSSMNGQESFFYDDCHFNEAGAGEVARLIAEPLASILKSARGQK